MQRIPLIEIPKGERVVKALEALWEKLVCLGEANLLENEKFPEGCSHKSDKIGTKDYGVTEFQCKLLELQLQYIQSLLKESRSSETAVKLNAALHNEATDAVAHEHVKNSVNEGRLPDVDKGHMNNPCTEGNCNKHTQTSLAGSQLGSCAEDESYNLNQKSDASCCRKHRSDSRAPSQQKSYTHKECKPKQRPPVSLKTRARNTSGHYHLKLSDVPFIVGTSTSSHSVIANVQKIISMMKNHNRALCSPVTRGSSLLDVNRQQLISNCYRACSESDLTTFQDVKNILGNLTKEVSTLTLKQENLKEKLEDGDYLQQRENNFEEFKDVTHLINSKISQIDSLQRILNGKGSPFRERRRQRSLSECSSCQFDKNYSSTLPAKELPFVKQMSKMEVKHVVCSYSRMPNTTGCSRRKMMQELREFQINLQHEDICWR